MAKDRSEFIHSVGDKLILGVLVAVFSFLIFEQIKNSISDESRLRARQTESANIISSHYLSTSREAIQRMQSLKMQLETYSRLGDDEDVAREELAKLVSSDAILGSLKIREMSTLAEPSPDVISQYDDLNTFLYTVSQTFRGEQVNPDRFYADVDSYTAWLVSQTNADVRGIVAREMSELSNRKKFWQMDGFWTLISAIAACLIGAGVIYFKLPA